MRETQTHFERGVVDFNHGRFWHAHEAWETIWLRERGTSREFLRGLIQLAAAYHHVQKGTLRGAARLFAAATHRLAPFQPEHLGVAVDVLLAAAGRDRQRISEWIRSAVPVRKKGAIARYDLDFPEAELPKITLQSGWRDRVRETLGPGHG